MRFFLLMKMNQRSINEALKFTIELSFKVGKRLVTQQKKLDQLKVSVKRALGAVSNADIEAENLIIKEINKKYPGTSILAEESDYEGRCSPFDYYKEVEWTWIVDPLDGTNNYLNGMDYFCVSIALCHFGRPVLGVVCRPVNEELFYATSYIQSKYRKRGKTKNIFKNHLSKKIKDSMLVTGFATEKGVLFDAEFDLYKKIMPKCRGVRRMGSAALDLCFVAQGTFDGFWERNLAPWDVAAASIICEKAGAKVTDYEGREFDPFSSTILASRTPIFNDLKKLLS